MIHDMAIHESWMNIHELAMMVNLGWLLVVLFLNPHELIKIFLQKFYKISKYTIRPSELNYIHFFPDMIKALRYIRTSIVLRFIKEGANLKKALLFVPARYIRTFDVMSEVNLNFRPKDPNFGFSW